MKSASEKFADVKSRRICEVDAKKQLWDKNKTREKKKIGQKNKNIEEFGKIVHKFCAFNPGKCQKFQ